MSKKVCKRKSYESDDEDYICSDYDYISSDNNYSEEDNKIIDLTSNDYESITYTKKHSRYISNIKKYELYQKYNGKCANNPNNPVINGYECPMWKLYNGTFDSSGYQIDHIEEFSLSNNNALNNLQPLCHCCHSVKTKIFMKNKCIFSSIEIQNGRCLMDIDNEKPLKKKKII